MLEFEEIYKDRFPVLYRFLKFRMGDAFAAEELLQDAFLALYEGMKRGVVENPRTYLNRVIQNKLGSLRQVETVGSTVEVADRRWGEELVLEREFQRAFELCLERHRGQYPLIVRVYELLLHGQKGVLHKTSGRLNVRSVMQLLEIKDLSYHKFTALWREAIGVLNHCLSGTAS